MKLVFKDNDIVLGVYSTLSIDFISIGRTIDNVVQYHSNSIGLNHACVVVNNQGVYIMDVGNNEGTFLNGFRLLSNKLYPIEIGDSVTFTSNENYSLELLGEDEEDDLLSEELSSTPSIFAQSNLITIGKSVECDIVINDKSASKKHATLENLGGGVFELRDLATPKGTFHKGNKIESVFLTAGDVFYIGTTKIDCLGNTKSMSEETAIKVVNLSKRYNETIGIHPTTFEIMPKTLTAIMGPSGCGKSTLLKMLSGMIPMSGGEIALFDLDIQKNFQFLKRQIGYVPQDDIVHLELTVFESLYYAAKIRLENHTEDEIIRKILHLLKILKIDKIKNSYNHSLSGGQRKRVCIAIELLTEPTILFLDEPTSPLDPQSVEEFLKILKNLSKEQTTIVLVTHKPEDLYYMDEVIFLAEGGYMVYKGPVEKYKSFFDVSSPVEVYSELSGENAEKWIGKHDSLEISENIGDLTKFQASKVVFWKQFFWLSIRNLKIKTNDRLNTSILLFQAPIIAFLIAMIFNELTIGVLFMMCISAIWFGVNNASRKIVKEQAIFARERMQDVKVGAYIASKMFVLFCVSVIQSIAFIVIISFFYKSKLVALNNEIYIFLWMVFISMLSSLFGLLISASMKTIEKVMALVPIVLIPQIMLAGMITKLSNAVIEVLSYFTISRWGTEGISYIQREVTFDKPKFVIDSHGFPKKTKANEFIYRYSSAKEHAILPLKKHYHSFYNDFFGSYAYHFYLDVTAMVVLGLLMYFSLYLIMKNKKYA